MAFQTYVLTFAESLTHMPADPLRTLKRATGRFGETITYKVWPDAKGAEKVLELQTRREKRPDDWRPSVKRPPCKLGLSHPCLHTGCLAS